MEEFTKTLNLLNGIPPRILDLWSHKTYNHDGYTQANRGDHDFIAAVD